MADQAIVTPEAPTTVHVPDFRMGEPVILERGKDDVYMDALMVGSPVVSSEFEVDSVLSMEVVADKVFAKERSTHQVGFGSIKMIGEQPGETVSQAVALKPLKNSQSAIRETRGYLTLAELGVETYEPIGSFPAKHGEHFVVVTRKRNDLTSLDRDQWLVGRKVVDAKTAEIAKTNTDTVKGIAHLLGYIHSNGVFHPDGQIKNYAKTPDGEIGLIDTENLKDLPLNHPDSVDNAWSDINKLVKSLIIKTGDDRHETIYGVGMLHGMSLRDARSSIEELIINPYLESLMLESDTAEKEKARHIEELFSRISKYFESDKQWPNHLLQSSK